jgi:hypothetical protein
LKFEEGEGTELKQFEDILVQCIEDIEAGRSTIEDCLDRYPSMREHLEPLLRIALEIRESPDVKPSATFKVKARVWLMDQLHGRQATKKWPWSRYDSQAKPAFYVKRFSTSTASIILVIVLALSAVGGSTVYAAQDSLPGDALYSVKLGTEQVMMILPGDDVVKAERALSFADKRVREMEVLAEGGRSQDLDLAVEKYGYALNITVATMEQARNRGLAAGNVTARVAEATARHLSVLDRVWDMVPDEAKAAVAHARSVSQTGYFHALAALAKNNTVQAAEMNVAAMLGRLNRVRARVQDEEALQIALQQFEAMAEFGEEISRIAQGLGLNITEVEELIAEATSKHLEVLADVWERVPEQARPAIERAMANLMIRHQKRIQALEQKGAKVPPAPAIPERVRERMEERIREQGKPDGTTPPGQQGAPGDVGNQNGHGAT